MSDRSHVLVVEDEPELADIFSIWLSDGFDVEAVTRGEQALSLLESGWDAIILDWRLPDVSGEEILSAIQDADLDTAVAVITGADPELISVGDEVDLVLRKPIRSHELIEAVEELTA